MSGATDDYIRALEKAGIAYERQVPLSAYSTFRIGGPVAVLVKPQSANQLVYSLQEASVRGIRHQVIGRGSNLLFADEGFSGVILTTTCLDGMSVKENIIRAECGVSLRTLSQKACAESLSGLEFATGIPGNCGGAVYMNAGAFGGQISDCITECTYYDEKSDKIATIRCDKMGFSYRESIFQHQPSWTILSAEFSLTPEDSRMVSAQMEEYRSRRVETQPHNAPNAGSFFKRPPTPFPPAGKMIDDCGLKGYRIGGAEISAKHAGFIMNVDHACAQDVLTLMAYVQSRVWERFGVKLEPEVQYIV